jgi:hypothetical protein
MHVCMYGYMYAQSYSLVPVLTAFYNISLSHASSPLWGIILIFIRIYLVLLSVS